MLKHASQTILVGERLAEAFHEGGVPADIFQNVVLDHDGTERLIAARSFGFINFTGSVGGGKAIERAAAGTFTAAGPRTRRQGPGLRDGGRRPRLGRRRPDGRRDVQCRPVLLRDRAHLRPRAPLRRLRRKGRRLDQRAQARQPASTPTRRSARWPTSASPKTVRDQTAEAIAAGAKPLIEPQNFPADDGGAYLMPQVLVNVDHSMRVMKEETFGPVVGIMPVKNDEEALALMNDCDYGLTASLWTADPERALAPRPPDRDRHRLPEPRRLSRPGDLLDRLQGHRPRRRHVGPRLPRGHAAAILPPQKGQGMIPTVNWSYPTAIKFGPGRIKELADACAQAGITRPLLVTDRGLASMAITTQAARHPRRRPASAARSSPRSTRTRTRRTSPRASRPTRRATMTASSPSAAARASTSARWSPSWRARRRPSGTSRISATGGPAPTRRHRPDRRRADHRRHRLRSRPRERHHRTPKPM